MLADQDRDIRMFGLRVMALIEGVTLLVLIGVAVPLKHLTGYPVMVSIVGAWPGVSVLSVGGRQYRFRRELVEG